MIFGWWWEVSSLAGYFKQYWKYRETSVKISSVGLQVWGLSMIQCKYPILLSKDWNKSHKSCLLYFYFHPLLISLPVSCRSTPVTPVREPQRVDQKPGAGARAEATSTSDLTPPGLLVLRLHPGVEPEVTDQTSPDRPPLISPWELRDQFLRLACCGWRLGGNVYPSDKLIFILTLCSAG